MNEDGPSAGADGPSGLSVVGLVGAGARCAGRRLSAYRFSSIQRVIMVKRCTLVRAPEMECVRLG